MDGAGLHAAHFLVVEGNVEGARDLDQAVITNDRDAFLVGFFDRRTDRVGILGEDDQGVGALCDQALDIGQLLARARLSVGGDIGATGLFDRGLNGGLVGLPALFLKIRPGDTDNRFACSQSAVGGHKHERARGEKSGNDLHGIPPCLAHWAVG